MEVLIKKKERENRNFKRLLEFSKVEKIELEEKNVDIEKIMTKNLQKVSEKPFAFLRSSFMKGPIPTLPPLANKKLEIAL